MPEIGNLIKIEKLKLNENVKINGIENLINLKELEMNAPYVLKNVRRSILKLLKINSKLKIMFFVSGSNFTKQKKNKRRICA